MRSRWTATGCTPGSLGEVFRDGGIFVGPDVAPAGPAIAPPLCADPTSGDPPARPIPYPNPATDIVVGGFAELADHFGA